MTLCTTTFSAVVHANSEWSFATRVAVDQANGSRSCEASSHQST